MQNILQCGKRKMPRQTWPTRLTGIAAAPRIGAARAPALTRDGCPPVLPIATLELCPCPIDSCSTPLSRTPFVDSTELALIVGEPHTTIHRTLADLLADGIVGRVSHGTAHLPSSQRYHLTAQGVRETADLLGFDTPSDYLRAYPMSREWLTLLIRRMDAVAGVYRLAASMSPGIDGLRSRVEFHRRGRFDATVTLHDGRDFGVVR